MAKSRGLIITAICFLSMNLFQNSIEVSGQAKLDMAPSKVHTILSDSIGKLSRTIRPKNALFIKYKSYVCQTSPTNYQLNNDSLFYANDSLHIKISDLPVGASLLIHSSSACSSCFNQSYLEFANIASSSQLQNIALVFPKVFTGKIKKISSFYPSKEIRLYYCSSYGLIDYLTTLNHHSWIIKISSTSYLLMKLNSNNTYKINGIINDTH